MTEVHSETESTELPTPIETKGNYPMIFAQMSKVMRDIAPIAKEQENKAQKFKFRGIDDVYNAVNKVLAKHGVFTTFEEKVLHRTPLKDGRGWHMVLEGTYHFHAEDGSRVSSDSIGEAVDYGDKCASKCLAIGHKYTFLQVFCIPTKDAPDPDAESHVNVEYEEKEAMPNARQPQPQQQQPHQGGVVEIFDPNNHAMRGKLWKWLLDQKKETHFDAMCSSLAGKETNIKILTSTLAQVIRQG